MNKFKNWNNKLLDDCGSYMSTEAKKFYRAFKDYLKRSFSEAELIGFKPNHYDFSGFIHTGKSYIYVSHSLRRTGNGCYADFDATGAMNGVLYRTAKDAHDYRGGNNNFSSIFSLVDNINSLIQREEHLRKIA